ncbi:Uncharacterized protein Adt_22981 [Abeliophyllum distichum]|uniref:Putative plant transposon protein domain-containing protein n=1 Tax=Abeliophyllum distichum TaxID=126358 RepID=A0ABD1SAD9_9LAMI
MPTEEDMQSVTRFLYGRENVWPLATSQFKHDELTREIRALHIFVCTNINPTTQRTKFIRERARLLYHLARGSKMDLGTYIFDFVRDLATSVASNSQHSIMFPCLISGICLEAGVLLLPFETLLKSLSPIRQLTIQRPGCEPERSEHSLLQQYSLIKPFMIQHLQCPNQL